MYVGYSKVKLVPLISVSENFVYSRMVRTYVEAVVTLDYCHWRRRGHCAQFNVNDALSGDRSQMHYSSTLFAQSVVG